MTGDMHSIEVQVDEHCFNSLKSQAERLGVEMQEVVQRAMSAWLSDICENEGTVTVVVDQG